MVRNRTGIICSTKIPKNWQRKNKELKLTQEAKKNLQTFQMIRWTTLCIAIHYFRTHPGHSNLLVV